MIKSTIRDAATHIRSLDEFDAKTMSGKMHDYRPFEGRMTNPQDLAEFDSVFDRNKLVYVVYSYSTPIGWYDYANSTWYKVAQKHSVTTSKHWGKIPN